MHKEQQGISLGWLFAGIIIGIYISDTLGAMGQPTWVRHFAATVVAGVLVSTAIYVAGRLAPTFRAGK